MPTTELQYEPITAARPVTVERDAGVTRIIVAMPGVYAPVPAWLASTELALIIAPIWWVASLIVRTCLRRPKPPRAVFEISDERIKLTLRDSRSGEVQTFDWPRAMLVEARVNRYERGLWVHVTGHVKETYLADLPREWIERIEKALREVMTHESVATDNSQLY
jgi:hypothetical protein